MVWDAFPGMDSGIQPNMLVRKKVHLRAISSIPNA